MEPLARIEGVISECLDDELLVYNPSDNTAHCLSAQAASIWKLCDGKRSTAEIADQLGLTSDRVLAALEQLVEAGLLGPQPSPVAGVSRREVAKRFAQLGAAALSAPMIVSMAVPSAAAAASGLCAGKNCNDNNACTQDSCDPNTGTCVFTPIVCNDNNACTTDSCNPAVGCVFTPIVCNDNNPCTTDSCNPATGCVFTNKPDGTPCNGTGTCTSGVCSV